MDSDVFFNPFSLIDYLHLHNLFNDPQVEFLGKNDTEDVYTEWYMFYVNAYFRVVNF